MIEVCGAVRRAFVFPAPLSETVACFRDFERVLAHLAHLRCVRAWRPDQYRILYDTVEVGGYHVRVYCDVTMTYAAHRRCLQVVPLRGKRPVVARATLRSLCAPGQFASETIFRPQGGVTRVDYRLKLAARLPKPLALALLPDRLVEPIARQVAARRMAEIADGLITRSTAEYQGRPAH